MQPHSGAIATLIAQFRYDIEDQYYKVDCEFNHRQYSITLSDVYRRQLIFRVGNIYPCYTKVELEVGEDFSLQSRMDGKDQINFLTMSKESTFRIEHSHTHVAERFKLEYVPNIPDIVWIREGNYTKENSWKAGFEGKYEAKYRRSEMEDTILADGNRIRSMYRYVLP